FITDTGNNRVRKVSSDGIITSIAGTGVAGHSGDGGPATSAQVMPNAIAVHPGGDIYISDLGTGFSFIRRLSTAFSGHYSITDLGVVPGFSQSLAFSINDAGQIVGALSVDGSGTGEVAFLWTQQNGIQIVPTLPGATNTQAFKINRLGQVLCV